MGTLGAPGRCKWPQSVQSSSQAMKISVEVVLHRDKRAQLLQIAGNCAVCDSQSGVNSVGTTCISFGKSVTHETSASGAHCARLPHLRRKLIHINLSICWGAMTRRRCIRDRRAPISSENAPGAPANSHAAVQYYSENPDVPRQNGPRIRSDDQNRRARTAGPAQSTWAPNRALVVWRARPASNQAL